MSVDEVLLPRPGLYSIYREYSHYALGWIVCFHGHIEINSVMLWLWIVGIAAPVVIVERRPNQPILPMAPQCIYTGHEVWEPVRVCMDCVNTSVYILCVSEFTVSVCVCVCVWVYCVCVCVSLSEGCLITVGWHGVVCSAYFSYGWIIITATSLSVCL